MDTLTDEQKQILAQFRENIKDVKNSKHDDHALYKWLKARAFNLKKSEAMYRKSMTWRKEIGADTILETFTIPPIMAKYYPGGLCGSDKDGRPIWIDPLGGADLKGVLYSVKKSDIVRYMVYRLESLYAEFRKRTKAECRQIDMCVHVIDMDGFSSRFMWKPALDLYIEILHLLEDNYPETLRRTYFVNAPRLFQVGYNVIKKFIDKETAKKFKFLDGNWKNELSSVIDPTDVPVHYGGRRRDPGGDDKCKSQICYGGEVPKEHYRNREDFFPVTPKPETLGRSGTLTIPFYIPDTKHVIRFIFAVDSSDVEFACYLDPAGSPADVAQASRTRLPDPASLDVLQPPVKYECQRVPEDGMMFFDKPGVCYLQFRNPSKIYKRVVSHVIQVDQVDDDDRLVDDTDTDITANGTKTPL